MKKDIYFFISIIPFILLKLSNWGIRISDTNVYFNVAYRMLHGEIPYRDFFFANFPLFAYISSFYFFISRGNIDFFFFTSIIETIIVTFFIYKISFEKTKNYFISVASSLLYVYSFIVLSTSDHQTGVSSASLMAVLSFYFFQRKKLFLSGIFIALSFFTKAYFIPILLSFFLYLLIKKQWQNLKLFTLGSLLVTTIVIVPFLILDLKKFSYDIFGFSLVRYTGLFKSDIVWFFIFKDFLLFVLLLFNLVNFKKNLFFSLFSLFSIIFIFGYQDIYYLYLNFMTPFLCISFYELFLLLTNNFKIQKSIILTIVLFFLSLNLYIYIGFYKNLQKISDIKKIIFTIENEKPDYLYGFNSLTPALSVITNTPSLANVNDAHVYFFRKGIYNKEYLTSQAVSTKTIIIAQGTEYPSINIKQDALDNEILDTKKVYKKCKNILSVPVQSEGNVNKINLFKCY